MKKIRFIRFAIKEASKMYDFNPSSLRDCGGLMNSVFEFSNDQNSYIIRFSHSSHRDTELIKSEIEFMTKLKQKIDVVSEIVLSNSKNICEVIPLPDNTYYTVICFVKARGNFIMPPQITSEFLYNFGTILGSIHEFSKQNMTTLKRPQWNEDYITTLAKKVIPEHDIIILHNLKQVTKQVETLDKNENNFFPIHSDLHLGNMFYNKGSITIFDWDQLCYNFNINDFAVFFFHLLGFPGFDNRSLEDTFKDTFLEFIKGYLSETTLNLDDLYNINLFISLRIYLLYIIIKSSGKEFEKNSWSQFFLTRYMKLMKENKPFIALHTIKEIISILEKS